MNSVGSIVAVKKQAIEYNTVGKIGVRGIVLYQSSVNGIVSVLLQDGTWVDCPVSETEKLFNPINFSMEYAFYKIKTKTTAEVELKAGNFDSAFKMEKATI